MSEEFKPVEHDDVSGDVYQHPSFGVISASRAQGTSCPLFGSSVLHSHTILVTISGAELHRGLHEDRIYGNSTPIVMVEMSPTQFADFITGVGTGGTPVTIKYRIDKGVIKEEPPYQNKVQQFNQEFEAKIERLSTEFDEVIQLARDCKAQVRLVKALEGLKQGFKNNLPFINEQFSEQMEHTVKEAKGAVEAFVAAKVREYGIEAIKKMAPQLPEAKETEGLPGLCFYSIDNVNGCSHPEKYQPIEGRCQGEVTCPGYRTRR